MNGKTAKTVRKMAFRLSAVHDMSMYRRLYRSMKKRLRGVSHTDKEEILRGYREELGPRI